MDARRSPSPSLGPDLLARYLNAYLHARRLNAIERPWGIGSEAMDDVWSRLGDALPAGALDISRVVAEKLTDAERVRVAETLAPLIFALPLRSYPAELRAVRTGTFLVLKLRHQDEPGGALPEEQSPPAKARAKVKKSKEPAAAERVGHFPGVLTAALLAYIRRTLRGSGKRARFEGIVSAGGRRRRVRVTLLAHDRGMVVRFLERLESPIGD